MAASIKQPLQSHGTCLQGACSVAPVPDFVSSPQLSTQKFFKLQGTASKFVCPPPAVSPQLASMQPDYSIHFLQLTGPEAELQAAADCEELGVIASGPAPDLAFLQMLKGMPDCGNFTYDAVVAGVLHAGWCCCMACVIFRVNLAKMKLLIERGVSRICKCPHMQAASCKHTLPSPGCSKCMSAAQHASILTGQKYCRQCFSLQ
jgi:hypothetical protein